MSITEILFYCSTLFLMALFGPKGYALLVSNLGKSNADLLATLAGQVVASVQQQLASEPGNHRKAAAVAALKGLADAHNLKVTDAGLHTAIESAVFALPKWIDTNFGQAGQLAQAVEADHAAAAPLISDVPTQPLSPAVIAPVK